MLWGALFVCLSLFSACSIRFVYRQLDWLIPWQLSDYVTFDRGQRSLLEQKLLKQLDWHCTTQLHAYAVWFRELQQAPQPFSREDIERNYQRTTGFWRVLMLQLSPDVASLLSTANDQQIDELFSNLEERNRELEKEYVNVDEKTVQGNRIDRMSDMISQWLGPLEPEQNKVIARWARDLGTGGEAWIANRRRWQAALRESLKLRGEPHQFQLRIEQLLVNPESLWPDSYKQDYARISSDTLDMLARVSALQTPAQERHLRYELGSWANDFESLACSVSDE